MLIKITQDHINRGVKTSPSCCPVARGIHEATGKDVCVGAYEVDVGKKFDIPLPVIAQEFIKLFDSHGDVEPFEFELEI